MLEDAQEANNEEKSVMNVQDVKSQSTNLIKNVLSIGMTIPYLCTMLPVRY